MAKIRPRSQKKARRATRQPLSRKLKLSKVRVLLTLFKPAYLIVPCPELPQDMGDLWSHWVGPSEPKKRGFPRCNVKNAEFRAKMGPGSRPEARLATGSTQNVAYWVSSDDSNKKFRPFLKKMDFGPKNGIFGHKLCIFLRNAYKTTIFSVQTDRLNWIIGHPYPEVTLDTLVSR